jgi:myo-inositol 2-dehydrogenase / D-chiro-inositol 1-dehydrogenase
MASHLRVALFGAGRMGKRHGRTIALECPKATLVAICGPDLAAAEALASELGVPLATPDPATIFDDSSVDAVVIAASTSAHAQLIIEAARSSKEIFCEKPVTSDLVTTKEAIAAVDQAGVRLQVGFQRRFDKGCVAAKERIERQEIGRVEMIRDTMRDPSPPPPEYLPTSGGLFRDMSIHNFDNVRWMAGDEPEQVFAFGANLVDPIFEAAGDIDSSVVSIRFRGGGLALIDNSRRSGFGYDVRTEIFGSEGALFVGYSRETPILHFSDRGVTSDHVHWFLERFDDAFVKEIQSFVASIQNDTEPSVAGRDGHVAMAMAVAAEASIREAKPVDIDRFLV